MWLKNVLLLVHEDNKHHYSCKSLSAHAELGNLLTFKFQSSVDTFKL